MQLPPQVPAAARELRDRILPYALHASTAAAAFVTSVAASQVVCYSLHVSSGARYIAPVLGCFSVAAASCVAGQAAAAVSTYASTGRLRQWQDVRPLDLLADIAIGLTAFKLLGGQFRSVLPSNLHKPGSFMRGKLHSYPPARSASYATDGVRSQLQLLYKRDGCHHCGKRGRGGVVGDHMPPNKLVSDSMTTAATSGLLPFQLPKALLQPFQAAKEPARALTRASAAGPPDPAVVRPQQWFLPQCNSCSSRQGGSLSAGGPPLLVLHFWRLRLHTVLTGPAVGMRYFQGPGTFAPGSPWGPQAPKNWRRKR